MYRMDGMLRTLIINCSGKLRALIIICSGYNGKTELRTNEQTTIHHRRDVAHHQPKPSTGNEPLAAFVNMG